MAAGGAEQQTKRKRAAASLQSSVHPKVAAAADWVYERKRPHRFVLVQGDAATHVHGTDTFLGDSDSDFHSSLSSSTELKIETHVPLKFSAQLLRVVLGRVSERTKDTFAGGMCTIFEN